MDMFLSENLGREFMKRWIKSMYIINIKCMHYKTLPFNFNKFLLAAYCHSRNSLASLCSYITGDALLYSMFREEASPVACPFRGPMTFSYNRGHGTCSNPPSNVDTCTDDSRLLFKYQACPDVSASESAGKIFFVYRKLYLYSIRELILSTY